MTNPSSTEDSKNLKDCNSMDGIYRPDPEFVRTLIKVVSEKSARERARADFHKIREIYKAQ